MEMKRRGTPISNNVNLKRCLTSKGKRMILHSRASAYISQYHHACPPSFPHLIFLSSLLIIITKSDKDRFS